MDKLKPGGESALDLDLNASPLQKLDTLLKRHQAKQSALALKRANSPNDAVEKPFVVTIGSAKAGTARMLTQTEIEDLRKTKQLIAEHTRRAIAQL